MKLQGQFGHPAFVTSGTGDADNDGLDDVVVSQLDRNECRGATFLLFGRDVRRAGNFDLLGPDGIEGFRIEGASPYTYSGYSLVLLCHKRDRGWIGAVQHGHRSSF